MGSIATAQYRCAGRRAWHAAGVEGASSSADDELMSRLAAIAGN